uniref:MCT-1 like PUA RNA binding-domain containing protein n=2 Tax=Solanum tuberosum TaxID=4113 RepID=M1CAV0_SOLTU
MIRVGTQNLRYVSFLTTRHTGTGAVNKIENSISKFVNSSLKPYYPSLSLSRSASARENVQEVKCICLFSTLFLNLRFNSPYFILLRWFSTEEVSGQNQVKASVQRRIRQSIAEEYPLLEPVLEDLLPKKSPLIVAKCQNHLNLVVVNNVPLFFNIRDGPYMPTLRLLHQYPNIMKKLQVDRGAIKFVLSGANIMCPGLTSPGGALDVEVGAETPVAIMAEGKQHALAIGFTKMSAKDIKAINKGIGVDNMHYLNDGLWKMERLD